MGVAYSKRGIATVGAGNQAYSSDILLTSGGVAFDAAYAGTTSATLPTYGLITITGADATSVYTLGAPPSDRIRECIITCVTAASSATAVVYLTTATTGAHFQSSATATTTERGLTFNHSRAYVRLMATSSHVWLVTAQSTGVLQASTG